MKHCEFVKECTFFTSGGVAAHPDLVQSLKEVYCYGNPLLCARRRVAMAIGRSKVPDDLNPNHAHRVQELLINSISQD